MKLDHRVSDYDFIRAMLRAGFRLTGTKTGYAVLEKGAVMLLVPQVEALGEAQIAALLQTANVQPRFFKALLERLGSRDTVPERGEV